MKALASRLMEIFYCDPCVLIGVALAVVLTPVAIRAINKILDDYIKEIEDKGEK